MGDLFPVARLLCVFCLIGGAIAQEPDALYISPAGHNYRADAMPLQSAETVRASLLLAREMGIRRVYWRGFQERYLNRHGKFQKENHLLADYWSWLRELDETRDIHRAAVKAGEEAGLEMWGVFGLFDLGSDPREDAYAAAAAGHGPAVFDDSLRLEFPDEIPKDRHGIRSQCGTLRFTNPEVRKKLIARLVALMDEGYQGLLLYTYSENLSLWFEGEFDRHGGGPLTGEEVTLFVRELRGALVKTNKRLALQVDPRAAFRYLPSPWLGLTSTANVIGNISIAWKDWLRDGVVDEIIFSVPVDAGPEAVALAKEMTEQFPKTGFSLLARNTIPPPSSIALTVDARSVDWRAKFLHRALSVNELRPWAESVEGRPVLSAADSATVVATMSALCKSPSSASAIWLTDQVRNRHEFSVRQQAGETLGTWGSAAAEPLTALAADEDPAIRRVAFNAATKLASFEQARPLLELAIRDADAYNRWVGFRGMGRAPMDAAWQGILASAISSDPDPAVRSVAAWLVRPGIACEPGLFEALSKHFIALHREPSWNWEFRTVGNALINCGAKGRTFLEACLAQKEDANLADSSWRCLFVPQDGGKLNLVQLPEALKAYDLHPHKP